MADLVIAVVQGRARIRQQTGEPFLALDQRPWAQILAVEMQKAEQEEDEGGGVAAVGASWIMLKEVTPSARTPHNLPSR